MKIIFKIVIPFLVFNIAKAQNVSGVVLDSISKKPLELASITLNESNQGVYSDAEGKFNVSLINANDYLLISYLGYTTKKISAINFLEAKKAAVFYLSPTTEELNEVSVQSKKINYGWSKTINSKREKTQYFGFQFGTENCTYIKNPDGKKGKIKEVILDLRKQTDNKDNPKWKLDYLTDYNIKFYEIDLQKGMPGEEIYSKDIIVDPKNETRNFVINVDSLNIVFPENGVCVGVEMINTRYKNPKKTFATIGPVIKFTDNSELHPIMAWERFRYDGKWEFRPVSIVEDGKRKKYTMMIVDLVIKPEKE